MMKVYAKELPATADPQGVLAALPVIRRPPCGAHGCEAPCCILSLSTVHCHCPVYSSPPLMVPRQTRKPQNAPNPEVAPNWLGAFRCTGVMRERQRPRNIRKRKPRASAAPKQWKT